MANHINVFFRKKPYHALYNGDKDIIYSKNGNIYVNNNKSRVLNKKYLSEYKNATLLEDVNQGIYTKTIHNKVLNKEDILFIAYGQTGSGKTHTLTGTNGENGIIYYAMEDLLKNDICECSVIEVYNDKIYDLSSPNKMNLDIFECNSKFVFKQPPIFTTISTMENFKKYMIMINNNKRFGQTKLNKMSSRSHTLYFFNFKNIQQEFIAIDLAGNERGTVTLANNLSDKLEYSYINKSLFALKECIRSNYLSCKYVPYRRSKLTMLLRDIFYKKINIFFLGTLHSSNSCYNDITDTIEYGQYLKQSTLRSRNQVYSVDRSTPNTRKAPSNIKTIRNSKMTTQLPKITNNRFVSKKNDECLPEIMPNNINNDSMSSSYLTKYNNLILKQHSIMRKHHNIYNSIKNNDIPYDKIRDNIKESIYINCMFMHNNDGKVNR